MSTKIQSIKMTNGAGVGKVLTSDASGNATWQTPSGGGGGSESLDTYYVQDMEDLFNVADYSTGNNAAFMGGGTLQGTLSLDESTPISGTKSLKYVQASGSVNDYFASTVIDLDLKQKNNTSGMTLYFEYDGNDNDGRFVVYDVTNSIELASEVNFVKVANSATRYSLSFYIPESCTQIRWGYKVLVQNTGKALIVDDVEMSTNPFMYKDLVEALTYNASLTANMVPSSVLQNSLLPFIAISNPDTNTFQAVMKTDGLLNISASYRTGGNVPISDIRISINGVTIASTYVAYNGSATAGPMASATLNINAGDIVQVVKASQQSFNNAFINMSLIRQTSHVLTPSDTFSTDTAPLTYASSAQYNLTTLANAPIGTYITFTYAANTNARTQTTTRPTQTDASMNQNGMQIFTRAYNAASIAGNPSTFAIQIGKGLKGTSLELYQALGKVGGAGLDLNQASASIEFGINMKTYNSSTGILIIDAGLKSGDGNTSSFLKTQDGSNVNNGYLTINAGRTLPLLAVPVPLVAYLKDVKPSGTAGGTFTAGAWQTRTLNTVEGDGSIVSLNANTFTLGPGKYEIEVEAPGHYVGVHKCVLYSVTDTGDALIGSSERSQSQNTAVSTKSKIAGTLNLTNNKTFEIRHRCSNTVASNGFGEASNFGVSEVYTQVKIVRKG